MKKVLVALALSLGITATAVAPGIARQTLVNTDGLAEFSKFIDCTITAFEGLGPTLELTEEDLGGASEYAFYFVDDIYALQYLLHERLLEVEDGSSDDEE